MMAQTYTTRQGDTLSQIARRFNVPMSSITGYRSGNANRIGVGEVLNIGGPTSMPPANSINANNLNTQPFNVPQRTTPTGYYGMNGLISNTQRSLEERQKINAQYEKDSMGLYDQLGGQATRKNKLYESEGVNAAKDELEAIKNTMRAREQAYISRVDRIRNNNPTGALASGQDIEIDRVTKDHAIERSADAITAEFKLGNYESAKGLVDSLVEAETEDLKLKLEAIKTFGEKNYALMTQDQRDLLQQQETAASREYQESRDLQNDIGSIMLKAAEAGATGDTLNQIFKSGDIEKAISLAAPFIGTSGGNSFTTTQSNGGAAKAGVDLQTFQGYDADTKNFFINADIPGLQKSIDEAFTDEEKSIEEVQAGLKELGLPEPATQFLLSYADKSRKENVPTAEELATRLVGQGYSRDEASDELDNWFSYDGSAKISPVKKKEIKDALNKSYGKTFWGNLFGR